MIPIGEVCKECGKIHLIKPKSELDSLSPSLRVKIYKSEHRVFRDFYYASLDINNEVHEYYDPIKILKISLNQGEEDTSESDVQKEELEEILDSDTEED